MTDTELLREKIDNSGYRFNWIAKQLNLTPYGLRKKINGETEFTCVTLGPESGNNNEHEVKANNINIPNKTFLTIFIIYLSLLL